MRPLYDPVGGGQAVCQKILVYFVYFVFYNGFVIFSGFVLVLLVFPNISVVFH